MTHIKQKFVITEQSKEFVSIGEAVLTLLLGVGHKPCPACVSALALFLSWEGGV